MVSPENSAPNQAHAANTAMSSLLHAERHWRGVADERAVETHRRMLGVIHLTWIRKREIDAKHPSVCFDGSFGQFVAEEQKKYELERTDG